MRSCIVVVAMIIMSVGTRRCMLRNIYVFALVLQWFSASGYIIVAQLRLHQCEIQHYARYRIFRCCVGAPGVGLGGSDVTLLANVGAFGERFLIMAVGILARI